MTTTTQSQPLRLLVNLPAGFFTLPLFAPIWDDLAGFAEIRKTSLDEPAEILPHLQWADAVLTNSWPPLTPDVLDQCPRLRFCAHLDILQNSARELLARNIPVSLGRRGYSPAVAEMALGLMLSTLRKSAAHQMAMRAGTERWVRGTFPAGVDPEERELSGRRVGLVGFGGIGQRLSELLAPFACDVRVYDPFLPPGLAESKGVGQSGTMDDLCAHAEVLVLCAASNPGTRHLVTAGHIAALAPGAVFVNVARAALVDNDALLARLQTGDLYAALDVFDKEPLPADSPFRALPNVFLTPHRAGGTLASAERIVRYLADDLRAWHQGRERAHALTEALLPALDA